MNWFDVGVSRRRHLGGGGVPDDQEDDHRTYISFWGSDGGALRITLGP